MADYRALGQPRFQDSTDGEDGLNSIYNGVGADYKFEQEVRKIMEELGDLLISKHRDYGPKNISESPGGPLNGLRVRMHDKSARINNLIDSGADAENEPLEDSFKDIANYGVIAMMVLREKWPSK